VAKIFYSALVNRIAGRVSHSVLSYWKGIGIIKRHNAGVHQPRSERQQAVRGHFNDIAGEYYALAQVYKDLWAAHASMLAKPLTPLNAYVKYNMRLEMYLPGTTRLSGPPKTPDTPGHVIGFTVSAIGSSDFCVEWTSPTETTIYTIVDFWAMPGRDAVTNPRWTFAASAGANSLLVAVTSSYPADTIVKFRVRTMDDAGRVSPWSNTLMVVTI